MRRRLTVEADGGSRGNPGVAGYGALVRDTETGALLAERAEPLGKASNNVAEYRGLIENPPPRPCSANTGTPASESVSRSRRTVRRDTPSRAGRAAPGIR